MFGRETNAKKKNDVLEEDIMLAAKWMAQFV